jgi:alpha-L-fucosidase
MKNVFGYKDLIPLWTADKWNPEALVELYKEVGAKYVVAVAVHHDNFDCYNSAYQPWNSVNMGPKRDIVGEWKAATIKQGLRFGVTSHSDRSWSWFSTAFGADSTGPMQGVPYDGNLTSADGEGKWWEGYDPRDLYGPPHRETDPADSAYLERWLKRTRELITNYQPDLIYFDGPIPLIGTNSPKGPDGRPTHEKYGLDFVSWFYNTNQTWHQGNLEAVCNIKSWGPGSIADEKVAVIDVEKGGIKDISQSVWQTDTSLPGSWFYNGSGTVELSDTVLVHNFCDIVSKNGNLMLNVGLRPDGTLPENEADILRRFGKWMQLNGEAIYGTRPWIRFGEGSSETPEGHFEQNVKPMTADDIRFTTKGNTLYAIVMGWPESNVVTIQSLNSGQDLWFGEISSIQLMGCDQKLGWDRTKEALEIQLPDEKTGMFAYVLKIN